MSLIECYKIVFNLNGLDFNDYLDLCKSKTTGANLQNKIQTKSARVNYFKYPFFMRIIKPWNNLPNNVFEVGISVKGFKSHQKTLKNIYSFLREYKS